MRQRMSATALDGLEYRYLLASAALRWVCVTTRYLCVCVCFLYVCVCVCVCVCCGEVLFVLLVLFRVLFASLHFSPFQLLLLFLILQIIIPLMTASSSICTFVLVKQVHLYE